MNKTKQKHVTLVPNLTTTKSEHLQVCYLNVFWLLRQRMVHISVNTIRAASVSCRINLSNICYLAGNVARRQSSPANENVWPIILFSDNN